MTNAFSTSCRSEMANSSSAREWHVQQLFRMLIRSLRKIKLIVRKNKNNIIRIISSGNCILKCLLLNKYINVIY